MFSPDFAYFISFLLFSFFAYRYGHKKMRSFLDSRIQAIAEKMTLFNQEKEEAQLTLSSIKQALFSFQEGLKERDQELDAYIESMKEEHKKQLLELIHEHEESQRSILDYERHASFQALHDEIIEAVIQRVKKEMLTTPIHQESFAHKSLFMLQESLK